SHKRLTQSTLQIGRLLAALAAEGPDEPQDNHGDEGDARNDRHPRRDLVEPLIFWWRRGGRWRGGIRWDRRLSCLAHASHNASARHGLRVQSGRETPVSSAAKLGSPAPQCGDAGLMVVVRLHGFVGWV